MFLLHRIILIFHVAQLARHIVPLLDSEHVLSNLVFKREDFLFESNFFFGVCLQVPLLVAFRLAQLYLQNPILLFQLIELLLKCLALRNAWLLLFYHLLQLVSFFFYLLFLSGKLINF